MRRHACYETDALLAALEHDGAVVVPQVLSAEQCAQARVAIDTLYPLHWDEVHAGPAATATGRFMDRYLCVFNRDPYWLQFIDRPGLIELAEAVLGADCHIIGETAWRCHPGFSGDALHIDYLPFPWPGEALSDSLPMPMFIITVHFCLGDITTELAPTRVIIGSHRAGRAPHPDESGWKGRPPEIVKSCAGDCLVFRSDVWHAGSPNRTARDIRYLLQVHYGRREMAQHFSPFVEWRFNPLVLDAATRRQRRLLGDHEPGPYD
jgi:hypothetical protein